MVDVACFRKGDVFAAYKGISQPLQHFSHCTESGIQSESRRCRILRGTTRLNSGVELVAALYGMRTVAEPSHSAMWVQCLQQFPAGSTLQFAGPASGATWERRMWRVTRESTRNWWNSMLFCWQMELMQFFPSFSYFSLSLWLGFGHLLWF